MLGFFVRIFPSQLERPILSTSASIHRWCAEASEAWTQKSNPRSAPKAKGRSEPSQPCIPILWTWILEAVIHDPPPVQSLSILCLASYSSTDPPVHRWEGKNDVGPRYSAPSSPLVSPLSLLVLYQFVCFVLLLFESSLET